MKKKITLFFKGIDDTFEFSKIASKLFRRLGIIIPSIALAIVLAYAVSITTIVLIKGILFLAFMLVFYSGMGVIIDCLDLKYIGKRFTNN